MKNTQRMIILSSVIFALLISICGCEKPSKVIEPIVKARTILYPSAPDKPRIQFLTSISSSKDFERKVETEEISGFDKFLLGEEEVEEAVDAITKPYGIGIYDGKIYVCDVGKKLVEEINLVTGEFGYMTRERRMSNPVNIHIDRGWKYIADPIAGAIFVYGKDNMLKAILGKELEFKPVDVEVHGRNLYVTDMASNQIVVLDRITGQEVQRMGARGAELGQFTLIADLAMDSSNNIYATDKVMARITKFDAEGIFQQSIGQVSDNVSNFVRPKGIDIDRKGRIWVVDTAPEVAKVYDPEGRLLLFFGGPGTEPGNMSMPASILIDYDNVDLFKKYFAEGAQIEFLVFVTNQYWKKINVYGFGKFPVQEAELQLELEQMEEEYIELENNSPK